MTENKSDKQELQPVAKEQPAKPEAAVPSEQPAVAKEPAAKKFKGKRSQSRGGGARESYGDSEYEQQILDLARVTRVMAGGKRMRFRACIALGNRKGKIGLGLAKGADVTIAINKAVNQAKKHMLEVPLANGTIPHEITHKFGAARILLKPAAVGRGVICGGVMRIIAELAGIHNVTGKILGTTNNVTNAKCMLEALSLLRPGKSAKKAAAKAAAKVATAQQEVAQQKTE